MPERFSVEIALGQRVTAVEYPAAVLPAPVGLTFILAHGAGAGQSSAFIVAFATALAERGIDVVTFNFAYIEVGRRIPDANGRLEGCYCSVIETVRGRKGSKLAIGGKSMGGRIASQVAARGAAELSGLVVLGYPLHPPGRPDRLRAAHLLDVKAPMLFVQGSRDVFGTPEELRPIIEQIGPSADLFVVEGGDHSFKVLKSAGMRQQDVHCAVQDRIATWLRDRAASA
jgi:predicted alpha/beta-hydrolase family hydrolase